MRYVNFGAFAPPKQHCTSELGSGIRFFGAPIPDCKTVNKRVRLTNELTQLLKEYFPQALDWAGELDRMMACDFLLK